MDAVRHSWDEAAAKAKHERGAGERCEYTLRETISGNTIIGHANQPTKQPPSNQHANTSTHHRTPQLCCSGESKTHRPASTSTAR